MITLSSFFRLIALIILVSYLLQRIFLRTIFPMKRMEYMMFSVFGAGPFISAAFLMLNFYIHTDQSTNIYRLQEVKHKGYYQYFKVSNIPCEQFPELCVVHEDDVRLRKGEIVEITVARGLFGYGVIAEVKTTE